MIASNRPGRSGPRAGRASRLGRRGAAAVEMAILAPVLVFINLIAIDFGRAYFYTQVLANCARNGAQYASDSTASALSPYSTLQQAALADATDLAIQPTITGPVKGTDSSGNSYVQVTASYTFTTMVTYPGIPSSTTISRSVQMRVAPTYNY